MKLKLIFVSIFAMIFASCNESVSELDDSLPIHQSPEDKEFVFSRNFDFTVLENLSGYMDVKSLGLNLNFSGVQTKTGSFTYQVADFPAGIDDIEYFPKETVIASGGQEASVRIKGTFGALLFRLEEIVSLTATEPEIIIDNGSGVTDHVYSIPANTTGMPKLFLVQYYDIYDNKYVTLTSCVQYSETISFESNITEIPLSATGGNYIVTQTGDFPSQPGEFAAIRVFYEDGHASNSISFLIYGVSQECNITIEPNNDFNNRVVYLQYSIDYNQPDPTWVTFETHVQEPVSSHQRLTDWRVVSASNDIVTAYGGTTLVCLSGNYNEIPVRVWGHNSDNQEVFLTEGVVKFGEFPGGVTGLPSGYDGAIALTIPPYEENGWPYNLVRRYQSYSVTQWWAQAYINGEWITLENKDNLTNSISQGTFRISIEENVDNTSRDSFVWPFKISGYWLNKSDTELVHIRICTNPGLPSQTMLNQIQIPAHNTDRVSADYSILVPTNLTGSQRIVYMMFSLDEGVTWNRWYDGWVLDKSGNGILIQEK